MEGGENIVIFPAGKMQVRTRYALSCNCSSRCCNGLSLDEHPSLWMLSHRDPVVQHRKSRCWRLPGGFSPLRGCGSESSPMWVPGACSGGIVGVLPLTAAMASPECERLYRLVLRQGAIANINILLY